MALPVLIIIFAAILYSTQKYLALQLAMTHARGQAWQQSANSCRGVVTEEPAHASASAKLLPQAGGLGATSALGGAVRSLLAKPLEQIDGEMVIPRSIRTVQSSEVLGLPAVSVEGSYQLICNTRTMTFGQVASDLWEEVAPW